MDLGQKIFVYCERGQDPAFWAEPLNALSNGAFIIAAAMATRDYLAVPPERRRLVCRVPDRHRVCHRRRRLHVHTYATRWAQLADMIPIAVFILPTLAILLRASSIMHWMGIAVGLVAFSLSYRYGQTIQCAQGDLLPITARAGARCLNGTAGYVPAFLALVLTTAGLAFLHHPAWKTLAAAAGVFLVSMTFRSWISSCAS